MVDARIVELFSKTRVHFRADQGADAREFRSFQKDRWTRLLGYIAEHARESDALIENMVQTFDLFRDAIVKAEDQIFSIDQSPDGSFFVTGAIPLLPEIDTKVADLVLNRWWGMAAAFVTETRQLHANMLFLLDKSTIALTSLNDPRLLLNCCDYLFAKSDARREASLGENIAQASASAEAMISDLREQSVTMLDSARTVYGQIQEFEREIKVAWTEFMDKSTEKIEAARSLAREAGTLERATEVWNEKLSRHRRVFGFGLAGITIVICAVILALIYESPFILASIPKKADNDVAYGVVILLLVPLIAGAWVLRIFARWVTTAMTLADDAGQRRAMLETYFRLVGDPEANMEQTERILILNAIFRPLPGHQADDVAPPTLTDLAKEALGGKRTTSVT